MPGGKHVLGQGKNRIFGTAKVGDRGQIVIPQEARRFYGISPLGVCLLAGTAAVTVTGCGKVNKDYDVYFFNQKSEIADSLNDLADEILGKEEHKT